VVEHLLAKEDVASSSLVTRSSLLSSQRSVEAKAGASALALAKADPVTSYGWQASFGIFLPD
jgi:hypothetical protein